MPVTCVTDSKGGWDHLNNPTPGSSSDLRAAIDAGDAEQVQNVLRRPGADINAAVKSQDAALAYACQQGQPAVVRLLLSAAFGEQAGLDVNRRGRKGLMWALIDDADTLSGW